MIGVSGGRDSMALLHFLVARGWRQLVVCHLNHRLRGREADRDESFVRQTAKQLGLRCETAGIDVARLAKARPCSLETAGRVARQDFFLAQARRHGCRHVLLAHHADDQAETVLHNVFRGAGLRGASGMSPALAIGAGELVYVRPLLNIARGEIDDYVTAHRIAFFEDSSNRGGPHTRNRIRHELIPLANDILRRDVRPLLRRFALIADRDGECLDRLAKNFAEQHRLFQTDGSLRLTAELVRLDPALQARVLRIWLAEVHAFTPQSREMDGAVSMLRAKGPAKLNLRGGRHLRRRAKRLWITQATSAAAVSRRTLEAEAELEG